jgi:hypothetical protein
MYLDALVRHLQDVGVEPGKVTQVEIHHAAECARWSGRECDCEPRVVPSDPVEGQ